MDRKRLELELSEDLIGCILTKVDHVEDLACFSAVCKAFHAVPWPALWLETTSALIQRALLSRHSLQKLHIELIEESRLEWNNLIDQSKSTLQEFSLGGRQKDVGDVWSMLRNLPKLSSIHLSFLSYGAGLSTNSCFPALKTAKLEDLSRMTNEDIQNLLKGAPLLEELQISSRECGQEFIIEGGENLKRLTLNLFKGNRQSVARCPRLEELYVTNVFSLDLGHESCSRLQKARLECVYNLDNEKLCKLLLASPCLKKLGIKRCPSISFIGSSSLERLCFSPFGNDTLKTNLRFNCSALKRLHICGNCLVEVDISSQISHLSLGKSRYYGMENLLPLMRSPCFTKLVHLKLKMEKTVEEQVLIALFFISQSLCLTTIVMHLYNPQYTDVTDDTKKAIKTFRNAILLSPQLKRIRICSWGSATLERTVKYESQIPGISCRITSGGSGHLSFSVDIVKS